MCFVLNIPSLDSFASRRDGTCPLSPTKVFVISQRTDGTATIFSIPNTKKGKKQMMDTDRQAKSNYGKPVFR